MPELVALSEENKIDGRDKLISAFSFYIAL
jgi:hypothetical protein